MAEIVLGFCNEVNITRQRWDDPSLFMKKSPYINATAWRTAQNRNTPMKPVAFSIYKVDINISFLVHKSIVPVHVYNASAYKLTVPTHALEKADESEQSGASIEFR